MFGRCLGASLTVFLCCLGQFGLGVRVYRELGGTHKDSIRTDLIAAQHGGLTGHRWRGRGNHRGRRRGARILAPRVDAHSKPVGNNRCHSHQHSQPNTDHPRAQRGTPGHQGTLLAARGRSDEHFFLFLSDRPIRQG